MRTSHRLPLLLLLLLLMLPAAATDADRDVSINDTELTNPALRKRIRLSWGIDIGSSIDLTTQDMSTLNADAFVGLRVPAFDVLGVGAGLHAMVNNNSYCYPIYGMLRTSFSTRPRLCFFELRCGVAINQFYDWPTSTAFYANPSVGFNLSVGKNFRSYLTLGYCYDGSRQTAPTDGVQRIKPVSLANVRLGISF